MKILFLTHICPYPPTNGGAIKTYNILKHLGSRHEIDLLTFIRCESEVAALSQLAGLCRRLDFCMIHRSPALNAANAARSLCQRQPFLIIRDRVPQMQAKVLACLEPPPDLIYVDHLQMFQYVPKPAPSAVLLDQHNVECRIVERYARCGGSAAARLFASVEWPKLRRFELDACQDADVVLTVTPNDQDFLRRHGVPGSKVTVLPIGVDTAYFRPLPRAVDSARVLTFGTMSWPPNTDGVLYFCREVYPLVKREVPEAEFVASGANPPMQLRRLSVREPSVIVTGYVDDIRKASEGAAVFVVPLRIGGGMRVKILDAMAMGLPVVSTSVGCEGIAAQPGTDILVADDPGAFAQAVTRLLKQPSERVRVGAAGRQLVERRYSWPSILARLDELLERLSPQPH